MKTRLKVLSEINEKKNEIKDLYNSTMNAHFGYSPDRSFSEAEDNEAFCEENSELFEELNKLEVELTKYKK
jgi:hypothetical protein